MATDYEKIADGVVESVKGFVKRALAPIIANASGFAQRLDKHYQRLESLEHRASRHATHLAELESRMKVLERKADK